MKANRVNRWILALALCGCVLPAGSGLGAEACVPTPEPPLPTVPLTSADQQFVDDFAAAMRQFQGLSVDAFFAEYGDKDYLISRRNATFLRGDSNGDGVVDIADVSHLLFYFFVGVSEPECLQAGDSDDSEGLDVTDAIYTLSFLFLGGAGPPAPYPEPGRDPTPGALECGESRGSLDYDPLTAEYLDLILAVLSLDSDGSPDEDALSGEQTDVLETNGFVVLENRRFPSFMQAYSWMYRMDLPVYVTIDSLLDTIHYSFDQILRDIEEETLLPELSAMLTEMEAGIEGLRAHAGGADIDRELDDVAVWICTARSLLAGDKIPCPRNQDAKVEELLGHVAAETFPRVELFGWSQCEDFSQFRPRGHYAATQALSRYFQAMMWIQRIGLKFAQIERHAAVAYLLAKCLEDTGAIAHWERIDAVVKTFVGVSDSLTPPQLTELAARTGIDSVPDLYDDESFLTFVKTALESGLGRQRILSQALRSNPRGAFTPIPPAFHLMGQRFIVDSFVFTNVVFDRVPANGQGERRFLPSPLDAMFVLGNHSTASLLGDDIRRFEYQANLDALRWIVGEYPDEFWDESLYNLWLSAIRALNVDTTSPRYPSVLRTRAWDRRVLNAQLASWAQLRHDTVLYSKPSYDNWACDYPDGWVDPYPEFYRTLARYAAGATAKLGPLGILEGDRGQEIREYLSSLRSVSETLAGIADTEVAGDRLSAEELEFVKGLVFYSYGIRAGWFQELLYGFDTEEIYGGTDGPELDATATVVDVATSVNTREVLHVGVGPVNVMILTVETPCANRAYVGPVYSYYEFRQPNLHRMTDGEWLSELEATRRGDAEPPRPAWTREFVR